MAAKRKKTPAWQRKEGKDPKGGLNKKGVASYRKANPGSKLQTAVTTKPSKLKKGSKAAKRRKSAKGGSKRGYPKCVPRSKARSMSASQIKSAVSRKRSKAQGVGGKPTNVKTIVKKKTNGKRSKKRNR